MLAALLKGLRHKAYLLHVLTVLGLCALVSSRLPVDAPVSHLLGKAVLLQLVWMNVSVFCLYYWDKQQAIRKSWRVPERTLHAFALAGGTLGAWIAQRTLRHKNRKTSFQTVFLLVGFLQFSALIFALILLYASRNSTM